MDPPSRYRRRGATLLRFRPAGDQLLRHLQSVHVHLTASGVFGTVIKSTDWDLPADLEKTDAKDEQAAALADEVVPG